MEEGSWGRLGRSLWKNRGLTVFCFLTPRPPVGGTACPAQARAAQASPHPCCRPCLECLTALTYSRPWSWTRGTLSGSGSPFDVREWHSMVPTNCPGWPAPPPARAGCVRVCARRAAPMSRRGQEGRCRVQDGVPNAPRVSPEGCVPLRRRPVRLLKAPEGCGPAGVSS